MPPELGYLAWNLAVIPRICPSGLESNFFFIFSSPNTRELYHRQILRIVSTVAHRYTIDQFTNSPLNSYLPDSRLTSPASISVK